MFMEIIPNHTDSYPKARSLSAKGYGPAKDRYTVIFAKRIRRVTSTLVTSMVTALIGKATSAATVRRRLHMSELYARVPRVCIFLSVQSRRARLKLCREHVN